LTFLVGTRGSKLSLAQTNWVISELQKENAGSEFEIKTITTKGDTDSRALFTIDQKGIFEKEIDKAVAEKQIDFAVHSLKDVPSDISKSLTEMWQFAPEYDVIQIAHEQTFSKMFIT